MARNFGRQINGITIHCSATSQTATVKAITNYWENNLGWKSPGYHYLIGVNGERYILSHLSKVTNGVRGHNWDRVNIAYIGGKYEDDRTDAQKASMEKLLRELLSDDILGPVPIVGHRDFSPDTNNNGKVDKWEWIKACPRFDVKEWLIEIGL